MTSNRSKRIYRSKKDRIIAGVCGGLAEYFTIDPTIIRIIYVLLTIFSMLIPFIVLYLILWVIIPEHP